MSKSEQWTRPTPAPHSKKSSLVPSLPTTRPSDDQAINAGPPRGQQIRLESSESYPYRHHQHKYRLEATSIVCSKLSEGLENPDLYLIMFNRALIYQGYLCTVNVPKEILQYSKTIYYDKYCKQHAPLSHPTSTPSNPPSSSITLLTQPPPANSSATSSNSPPLSSLNSDPLIQPPPVLSSNQPHISSHTIPLSTQPPSSLSLFTAPISSPSTSSAQSSPPTASLTIQPQPPPCSSQLLTPLTPLQIIPLITPSLASSDTCSSNSPTQ